MAVVKVKEHFAGRRSSKRDGVVSHTRIFLVECDDIHDGTATAVSAQGIPDEGDLHPTEPLCFVTGVDASPYEDDSHRFEVTVEYSTSGEEADEDPLNAPWDISWGSSESAEPFFRDANDKPVTNSAGQPFEQLIERDSGQLIITVVKNEATGNPGSDEALSHTVNNHDVVLAGTVFLEDTLKLSPIASQKQTTAGITYWRKTYQFKARRRGWMLKIYDQGYQQIDTQTVTNSDGDPEERISLKPILDKTGNRVERPYPLNGEGKAMPSPLDPAAELEFEPYEKASWASRGF